MKIINNIYSSKEIKRKQNLIKILHLKSFKIIEYIPKEFGFYQMIYSINDDEYKRLKIYIEKDIKIEKNNISVSKDYIVEILKGFNLKAGIDYFVDNTKIIIPIKCEKLRDMLIDYFECHSIFKAHYYFSNKTKKELILLINTNKYEI